MPPIGTLRPSSSGAVSPKIVLLSLTSGSRLSGMSSSFNRSASHAPLWMSNSKVREALLASVAWTLPPVSRHSRKLSIVPKASSPRSARARTPSTSSRIHLSLVPEKYGSRIRPVRSRTSGSLPSALSCAHKAAVRRSCQTIALWTGSPVLRSHTTTVSRWLVMPIPAIVPPSASAAACIVASVSRQMSSGSCSTQPAWG